MVEITFVILTSTGWNVTPSTVQPGNYCCLIPQLENSETTQQPKGNEMSKEGRQARKVNGGN